MPVLNLYHYSLQLILLRCLLVSIYFICALDLLTLSYISVLHVYYHQLVILYYYYTVL